MRTVLEVKFLDAVGCLTLTGNHATVERVGKALTNMGMPPRSIQCVSSVPPDMRCVSFCEATRAEVVQAVANLSTAGEILASLHPYYTQIVYISTGLPVRESGE